MQTEAEELLKRRSELAMVNQDLGPGAISQTLRYLKGPNFSDEVKLKDVLDTDQMRGLCNVVQEFLSREREKLNEQLREMLDL